MGGSDWEVFTWTPATGTVQLTENSDRDTYEEVSGDRVVWCGKGGTDGGTDDEIFTWTPATGTVQVTTNDDDDFDPKVSADRIVWCVKEADGYGDILTWTPQGGTVWITRSKGLGDHNPAVSGDRVVWEGQAGPGDMRDREIFTWTPGGGVVRITRNGTDDIFGHVSGDRVVWCGDIPLDIEGGLHRGEVFTWTPTGGIVQLTRSTDYWYLPQVSGGRVVWSALTGICTWTPAEGVLQIITNDEFKHVNAYVSDDRVVWQSESVEPSKNEIFTWTLASGTVQITNNNTAEYYPQVSGDRIVWQGPRGSDGGYDSEIFTATLLPEGPAFPDVPPTHPYRTAINGMASRGIVGGYANGNFGPDDLVMRQQFAKMIVGSLGLAAAEEDWEDASKPFRDLEADNLTSLYPHEYVALCARNNITKGTIDPTKFAPCDNIIRAQVITMVVRAADNLRAGTLQPVPAGWIGVLPVGDPAHGGNIAKAEYSGLLASIVGPSGTLAGWDTYGKATRGEVAHILWNLLGLMN